MAKTPKTYTLSQVAVKASELSGKDPQKVQREIRGRIRRNFDDLVEVWPELSEAKVNRDGNRYPPMSASAAQVLLKPYRAASAEDEGDEEDE